MTNNGNALAVDDDSIHSDESDVAQPSDNEAHSVMSDGAVPVDGQDEETQVMDEVETEEDEPEKDTMEFVETQRWLDLGGQAEVRIPGKSLVRWKGREWNVLSVVKTRERTVGIFLGFDSSVGLQYNWSCTLKFNFHLLDKEGHVVAESPEINNEFRASQVPTERRDSGNWTTFKLPDIAQHAIDGAGTFRFKLVAEQPFEPRKVGLAWDSKKETGMVGLENLGATCYLNALLQMLYHINSFRKAVYLLPHDGEVFKCSTTLALQSVFKHLQSSRREVTTKDLTTAFGWTTAESFMQQDVQEMMRVLIDKLEEKMANTVVDGVTKKLFAGKVRSFIKCVNVDYVSQREEDFYDIQLDVKGCRDIHESFAKYTENELLDGENQYAAEGFGKQDAKKGVIFTQFPPVLTIHLKRFDFNMQTMGFTKIHDRFEFPVRLELDRYLAADCSEEARAVPNVYILHSVLVHSGDVGGGHYYAYIRPSVGYDYSLPADSKRQKKGDAQWFKFNDEVVFSVKSKEAIEHCYGRKVTGSFTNFKGSMSSAYMLVYIRESDAGVIMSEVNDIDIPRDLEQRLEVEMKERREKERAEQREKSFQLVNFCTEDDVRQFRGYNKFNDLINNNSFKAIKLMRDSKRLNLLVALAKELNTRPMEIRLWRVERRNNCNNCLRIDVDIDSAELMDDLNSKEDTHFFVQHTAETIDVDVLARYEALRAQEAEWLAEARDVIYRDAGYEDEELLFGLGLGSSNAVLTSILERDDHVLLGTMRDRMLNMNMELVSLIKLCCPDLSNDHCLLFFRAFDQHNLLKHQLSLSQQQEPASPPSPDFQPDDPLLALMDCDVKAATGGDDTKDNQLNSLVSEKLSIASGSKASSTFSKAPDEYMPMKYLGFCLLRTSATFKEFLDAILTMVRQEYGSCGDSLWMDEITYRVQLADSPSKLTMLRDTIHGKPTIVKDFVRDHQMDLFVVDIPALLQQAVKYPVVVPWGITDPEEWLAYKASRKEFYVKPLFPRDAKMVQRIWQLEQSEKAAKSSASTAEQQPGANGSDPLTRKRNNSEGSHHSTVSAGGNSPSTPPFESFSVYLPGGIQLAAMVRLVAERLGVDPLHIALYMVQRRHFSLDEEREMADEIRAITCMSSNETVSTYISGLNRFATGMKSTGTFVLFYQISPFSFQHPDRLVPASQGFKSFELLLTDVRLRNWRKQYLNQLPGAAESILTGEEDSPVNISASALKDSKAESPVASGTNMDMKRRRLSPLPSELNELAGEFITATMLKRAEFSKKEVGRYEVLEVGKVNIRAKNDILFDKFTYLARDMIGIPKNIGDLMTVTHYMSARDQEAYEACLPVLMNRTSMLSQDTWAVVSDKMEPSKTGAKDSLSPPFAIVITTIRNKIVNDINAAGESIGGAVISWMDARVQRNHLWGTGVQHVTPLDMIFMQGKHPTVRSIILSVFSFTLMGNLVQPCEVDQFSGPFVTYLREDDDYDSLCARIRLITGDSEEDLDRCRLAVVKHKKPLFIKRPPITHMSSRLGNTKLSSTDSLDHILFDQHSEDEQPHAAHATAAQAPPGPTETIWSLFAEKYKDFVEFEFGQAVRNMHTRCGQANDERYFPFLGIQRSVQDVNAHKAKKHAAAKAIKIV